MEYGYGYYNNNYYYAEPKQAPTLTSMMAEQITVEPPKERTQLGLILLFFSYEIILYVHSLALQKHHSLALTSEEDPHAVVNNKEEIMRLIANLASITVSQYIAMYK